jgi:hypothetical protein
MISRKHPLRLALPPQLVPAVRAVFYLGDTRAGEAASFALAMKGRTEISLWGWFPIFHLERGIAYALVRRCRLVMDGAFEWRFDALLVTATLHQIVLWPVSGVQIVRIAPNRSGRKERLGSK